ncbi:hypothetical protein EVJ58_g6273 [Rhodofomes roseus]|uniref:Uncharacterized protein n=1 Tax=Rhodofomes roseus TaxID=34475 RepID=A0A4Y9Y8K3_9APHY|nr:hypothetical protein EVJ58_g6273 [Rhodofomes roseus]
MLIVPVHRQLPEDIAETYDVEAPIDPIDHVPASPMVVDEPPVAPLSAAGRPIRSTRNRLPKRYRDMLPAGPSDVPAALPPTVNAPPEPLTGQSPPPSPRDVGITNSPSAPARGPYRTAPNVFGLFREYATGPPEHEPDANTAIDDVLVTASAREEEEPADDNPYAPYPNRSSYLLGDWFWSNGGKKTKADLKRLVGTLQDPGFVNPDLLKTNWDKVDAALGDSGPDNIFKASDGWRRASVTIKVPVGTGLPPRDFVVEGLIFRPFEEVVEVQFAKPRASRFHFTPFAEYFQPPDDPTVPPERVYGEGYSSPEFEDIHAKLQSAPPSDCQLPRAAAACMVWSDSTHLSNFGTASLWPVYLMFANESKYERAKTSSKGCHHVAYIPKVHEGELQTFIRQHGGGENMAAILTHCRRELMHGVWRLILGDKFRDAYTHGVVVKCGDGILRRIYPRFFSYSADYPEKVLLASIRDMGSCPCPHCLIPKAEICNLGTTEDMRRREQDRRLDDEQRQKLVTEARRLIYEQGSSIKSTAVEALLKLTSLVPTEVKQVYIETRKILIVAQNAFSEILAPILENYHEIFVPDSLHEWDLGVWRQILIHLLRLLSSLGARQVHELDARFRQVATFGRDTIRSFDSNVSELKKLAARNFEDILQCSIPCFEGLFPAPHDDTIQDLLFLTAMLHGLHKLRMHTETTLKITEKTLEDFAEVLRYFEGETCRSFEAHELAKEVRARMRRESRKQSQTNPQNNAENAESSQRPGSAQTRAPGPRTKLFNLLTYKIHTLGYYPSSIRKRGTTDSYSTRIGESHHRRSKGRFERTSKNNYVPQIANIERRESRLHDIAESLAAAGIAPAAGHLPERSAARENFEEALPEQPYHIARSQKDFVHIPSWVRAQGDDPAVSGFVLKLKQHLLSRLRNMHLDEPSHWGNEAINTVVIKDDRMYSHQTLRVNYTTYDMRRAQDVINPRTNHRDVMLLASDDEPGSSTHPYWYARVLGIYHLYACDRQQPSSSMQRMDVLFVRWFGEDMEWRGGWKVRRLDRIGFVPEDDEGAFGFLDPVTVLRGSHLIPAFKLGRTNVLLRNSRNARRTGELDDWDRFYVGR